MPRRTITIGGERWEVYPSGRVTVYGRDEFGLVFAKGDGPQRVVRVTRYSPLGARRWDVALAQLSDRELEALFWQSQPAWTSPEAGYGRLAS
jgi:hypothetical protein